MVWTQIGTPKWFDETYASDERHIAAAINSYGVDTNWYPKMGATGHITNKLVKLIVHDKYHGTDHIHTVSGVGMEIKHIGHSIVHTPICKLNLNNVLHVPKVAKNLISIHCLAKDNSAFLEFHPIFFITEHATKNTPLGRCCHKGLYSLPLATPIN